MDLERGKARTLLLVEQSDVWINLHHMLKVRAVHPDECTGGGMERNIPPIPNPLPPGSFPFCAYWNRRAYRICISTLTVLVSKANRLYCCDLFQCANG
jgi:hypothetical protein